MNEAGLRVVSHEMQIGFFVNTASALVQIPLYVFGKLARTAGFAFPVDKVQEALCNKSAMAGLNRIDERTRWLLNGLYGWNLFVAVPS